MSEEITKDEAIDAIAIVLHRYDHPTYNTVPYCTFCHAAAVQAMELFEGGEES